MSRESLSLAALLLFVSFTAFAAAGYVALERRFTAEQMHATGLDTLTPEQLALLNSLLREGTPAAATAADARGRLTSEAPEVGAPSSLLGLNDQPIRSRAQGTVTGWEPGTVFTLANGQQWKVLKGEMKLRKPLQSPEVVVAPGLVGRWFLQVDEDLPKARVYRVD
jgi:hypothetical protein